MADLLAVLSQGVSSLSAHRAVISVAGHNIENANTPGFARQRAELEAMLPAEVDGRAYVGRGAILLTVSQARDRFLERQVPAAFGNKARSSTESEALASVGALDPDAAAGLSAALGDFYASMRALGQNASDPGVRQAVVGTTRRLTLAFNQTAEALASARDGLDAQLSNKLAEANRAAANIADLNVKITSARALGGEPNDLLDARQRAMDTLSELTGATPIINGQGQVSMTLANGTMLVTDVASATLSGVGDASNRGHLQVLISASGAPPAPVPAGRLGGTVGGLLDARDPGIGAAETGIDTLAFDFAAAVNTVHAAGFALDGTSGHALLDAGVTSVGAARRLTIDAAVAQNPSLLAAAGTAGTGAGDGDNVAALVATENTLLSGGHTAGDTLAKVTADFGASSARATAVSQQAAAITDQLVTMRESISGVSIDEEMVNLTKAQRAFEAVSKVITTASSMLETLMQIK